MVKITILFEIGDVNTKCEICDHKYQRDPLSQTGYL